MRGARFENTTDRPLVAEPVTVLDAGAYAGATETFAVRQAVPVEETARLLRAGEDQLALFARTDELPTGVRRAIVLREDVAEAERDTDHLERQLRELINEQARIRDNLQTVKEGADYYRWLLRKLEAQEDDIETLRKRCDEVRSARDEARERLRDVLSTLNAD